MIEVESFGQQPEQHPRHRRRNAMVAATIAGLLAGTGGFLVGRSTGRSNSAAGAPAGSAPTSESPPDSIAAPLDTLAPAAPTEPTTLGGADSKMAIPPFGYGGGGAYEEPQQELLAERTTSSGVVLRAHLARYPQDEMQFGGPAGWKPAGWCYPVGNIRVSVAAPNSVNLAGAGWFAQLKDGVSVATFASGYPEGHPMFGVVAQVDANVTKVTMTTPSGLTDSVAPANGVALLLVDGKIEQDVIVSVTKADGSTTEHKALDQNQLYNSRDYRDSCTPPPPALPDAGVQPADAAAADAAVRESWRIAHDFANNEPDQRGAFVDDRTGLADAWAALQSGQYADAARQSTTDIAEIVFTSAADAWFRYDVLTPITNFYDRYGQAHLNSQGVWQITRQTICQDIALAPGFACTPPVDTLLPPSAQNDPRYNPALIDQSTVGD
jgi:hypothetical protein